MKRIAQTLLLLALAAFAAAQTFNTPFRHVIVAVQENRTPDNLFQDPVLKANGADIVAPQAGVNCWTQNTEHTISLIGIPLDHCTNPYHAHGSWVNQYHSGGMDGACGYTTLSDCKKGTNPWYPCPFDNSLDCSQYTYVNQTIGNPTSNPLTPYFSIAEQYGFSNYSFQTNQGASFPAHQFLLSGTSAPDYVNDPNSNCGTFPCWEWFDSENNNPDHDSDDNLYGCIAAAGDVVLEIDPNGAEGPGYTPPGFNQGFPCYEHGTMPDLVEKATVTGLTWKYYTNVVATDLWTAPNAINHLCGPKDGSCQGSEWSNVILSQQVTDGRAPILEDIENCNLPSVSWVIPDGRYSDHGGVPGDFLGPAWVAAIVNAVGGAGNGISPCPNGEVYWNDTVILVTWDDWGGFYDHVLPWNCSPGPNGSCTGYSNGTGSKYIYGFRVPLLVISAYNKHTTNGQQGFTGYISGALPGQGEVPPYVHDFGSILNFTEWALGKNQQPLHFPGQAINSGISPSYAYADFLASDAYTSNNCAQSVCPYSLADFFVDFSQNPQPTPFTPIPLPPVLCNGQVCYNAEWFENYGTLPGDPGPQDPDQDATDPTQ